MDFSVTILVFMSSAFLFVYFKAEPWTLVTVLVKMLLLLACLTFIIQFIGKRLGNIISKYRSNVTEPVQDKKEHKKEQEAFTEKIQQDFHTKAEAYKKKILIPREEAKKRQKEEEYYRFLGPAWKGKGEALGGEVRHGDDEVRLHRLEENINEEFLQQVHNEQEREAKRKQRKKIVLPDEPDQNEADCLQIILRSPLGQIHSRRFLCSNKLQIFSIAHLIFIVLLEEFEDTKGVIFDYITTLGFNQRRYTIATTYPRQLLTEERELTLSDLEFTKRTTLNIEEIEE